jgi:glycosyltransferase involved in cell wall biosynthesis
VKKTVLCVASFFPPDASTGTHRTRAVVRHLPAFDWQSVVVCPKLDAEASLDPGLLNGLPEDLVVYRTTAPNLLGWAAGVRDRARRILGRRARGRAAATAPPEGKQAAGGWVDWASWWLQLPGWRIGWLPFGFRAALSAVRRHRCQAIYSSAPYFTAHLIALLTKWRTGLPWVADFRDPWRSSPFRKIPYAWPDRYDAWLENRVVRGADWVVCNTGLLREDFIRRYPALAAKFVTIPNGFDPEVYADLMAQRPRGPEHLVLTHTGFFYGKRRPEPLFQAVRLLRERASLPIGLCLQLVGNPTYEGKSLQAIAGEHGVEGEVLVRGEVPHRQVLELLRGSDIQVLVGFNGVGADLQVPAKFFEYLGVGRPVLALAPKQSSIAEMMASLGPLGAVCDPDDPEQIAAAIQSLATRHLSESTHPARNGTYHDLSVTLARFHRREQVGQIARLLETSTKHANSRGGGAPMHTPSPRMQSEPSVEANYG